jgi:hypothetical protein
LDSQAAAIAASNALENLPNELRDRLDKLLLQIQAMEGKLTELTNSTPPPETLYHYANDVGFRGILESGELHATDVANLNDPQEYNGWMNAYSILAQALRDKSKHHKLATDIFWKFASHVHENATLHRFVSCLSTHSDDLGQWRAYGDNGRGYILGFDGAELATAFEKIIGSTWGGTFFVLYDSDTMKSLFMELINTADQNVSFANSMNIDDVFMAAYVIELSKLLYRAALTLTLLFKHEAYKDEMEFCLLHVAKGADPGPGIRYKSRPYELVRYKSFPWRAGNTAVLKTITVGPAADPKAGIFVGSCLRAFHDKSPKVAMVYSRVPYRS